jgi:hypothetical protein
MPSRPAYRTLLASAARTASIDTADIANEGYGGVEVTIDATAKTATPSLVFTIQGKDLESGKYYTILASAAITDTGTTVLRVFPGAPVTTNVSANARIPAVWRVNVVAGDSDSLTYSVGATLLP